MGRDTVERTHLLSEQTEDRTLRGRKNRGSVLLVEDCGELLALMRKHLEWAGYSVVTATNGDLAKEIFVATGPYDYLVSDIHLPGVLQGTSLAAQLVDLHSDIQVIFVTGHATTDAFETANSLTDVPLLKKPISRGGLLDVIEQARPFT